MEQTASRVGATVDRMDGIARQISRYDLVLAVIPAAFVAAVLVGSAASVSFTATTGAASAVGLLAVVDALFLNPPRESSGRPPAA